MHKSLLNDEICSKALIIDGNHNTNILKTVINTGKIYMKSELIDPGLGDIGNNKINSTLDNISIFTSTTNVSAMSRILKNNIKLRLVCIL
jgi:hypothetical protein